MEKLQGTSMDIVQDNMEKLKQIFPEVFTEGKIDFEVLKQLLGEKIENDKERYSFTWKGKTEARQIAQDTSTGTLRPSKKDSKDWENTENLYIEGDNLEVLKLLQKSYHGKIKMIYIDPPYNTGKDFVYKDNFRDNIDNYLTITGQKSENSTGGGYKLSTNTESNGRYHSDWLSMMYPRLKLARNLLTEDGLIFVQIDDKEYENLLKIMKEIFGEGNFVNSICVNMSNLSGPKINNAILGKKFPKIKEYVLVFSKNKEQYKLEIPKQKKEKWDPEYNLIIPELTKEEKKEIDTLDIDKLNLKFGKYRLESLNEYMKKNNISVNGEEQWQFENSYRICASKPNTSLLSKANKLEFNSNIYFLKNESNDTKLIKTDYNRITKTARIELLFAEDKLESFYGDHWADIVTTGGVSKEGDVPYPNAKKPLKLLKRIIKTVLAKDKEGIVLDFFSGSATTAHAVMQLNVEDRGNRKYIMVQLPEDLETSKKNTGDKNTLRLLNEAILFLKQINKPTNICEIGKERIRRAGEKIKEEIEKENSQLKLGEEPKKVPDIGFKVFKLDSSNIKEWDSETEDLEQSLFDSIDNIKSDRSSLDILYEILLKYGLDLNVPIIENDKFYSIGGGTLLINLDKEIDMEVIDSICEEYKNLLEIDEDFKTMVVLRDSAFKNDVDKTNAMKKLEQVGIKEVRSI